MRGWRRPDRHQTTEHTHTHTLTLFKLRGVDWLKRLRDVQQQKPVYTLQVKLSSSPVLWCHLPRLQSHDDTTWPPPPCVNTSLTSWTSDSRSTDELKGKIPLNWLSELSLFSAFTRFFFFCGPLWRHIQVFQFEVLVLVPQNQRSLHWGMAFIFESSLFSLVCDKQLCVICLLTLYTWCQLPVPSLGRYLFCLIVRSQEMRDTAKDPQLDSGTFESSCRQWCCSEDMCSLW